MDPKQLEATTRAKALLWECHAKFIKGDEGGLKLFKEAVEVSVDGDDPVSLARAMEGYDIAASALGPFNRFESKLVRASLDAGLHYTSVCDEYVT